MEWKLRLRRGATTLLLVVAAGGCKPGGEDSTLALAVAEHSFDPVGFAGLSAEIREGGRVQRVTSADFRRAQANQSPHTHPFRVGDRGMLNVLGVLAEGADTIARGEVAISLRPDTQWSVSFERGVQDPMLKCFGCLESRRFDIAPDHQRITGESFWITVSGRQSSEPGIVY